MTAGPVCAVKTTCPYCGVGCGVLATLEEGGAVTIKGDHRTFVTKPVREELPMVPGPEELQ